MENGKYELNGRYLTFKDLDINKYPGVAYRAGMSFEQCIGMLDEGTGLTDMKILDILSIWYPDIRKELSDIYSEKLFQVNKTTINHLNTRYGSIGVMMSLRSATHDVSFYTTEEGLLNMRIDLLIEDRKSHISAECDCGMSTKVFELYS